MNPPFSRSIFIDSANFSEIQKWNATGVIDGVTTNQFIFLQDKIKSKDYHKTIKKICTEMHEKPVSVELNNSSLTEKEMIRESKELSELAENIIIKIPLIPDTVKSLKVIQALGQLNIAVNITLMMTFEQMVMAILASRTLPKTTFVSLLWGRSQEDYTKYHSRSDFMAKYHQVGTSTEINSHHRNIIRCAHDFINEGGYDNVKIIAGSIRTAAMAGEAFAAGTNIVTITPDKLTAMLFSKRTW